MRHRRDTASLLIAPALLILAGEARASTISMVWISTGAAGAWGVGTPDLATPNAMFGDTAVLEIRVNVASAGGSPGIGAIGVSFPYDPGMLAVGGSRPARPRPAIRSPRRAATSRRASEGLTAC